MRVLFITIQALAMYLFSIIIRHRFTRFGTVGFSGMLVNLAVLYMGQEIFFRDIPAQGLRLHLALMLAIFIATMNNFFWNRIWTWGDRKDELGKPFFLQMGQYYLACVSAMTIQFVCTIVLSMFVHYLAANIMGIVFSSLINYLLNDRWTFSIGKKILHRKRLRFLSYGPGLSKFRKFGKTWRYGTVRKPHSL